MHFHSIKLFVVYFTFIIAAPSITLANDDTSQSSAWPTAEDWRAGNTWPTDDTVQTNDEPDNGTESTQSDTGGDTSETTTDDTPEAQQSQLQANDDSLSTAASQPLLIEPLSNDIAVSSVGTVQIMIVSAPEFGQAELQANNTVLYSPTPDYIGFDSFSYRLTDGSNESSTANVTISIENTTHCNYTVGLRWLKSSAATKIAGFTIYHGTESGKYTHKEFVGHVYAYDYCANETGTHYFAASTKDIYGNESALTSEVKAIILE